MRSTALAVMLLFTILSGCANTNSIYRTTTAPITLSPPAPYTGTVSTGKNEKSKSKKFQSKIITVDAKQRHLILNPETENFSKVGWRVCAESPPDIFSVFASSFAGEGDRDGGKLSAAISESGASLERTQTVNLLRESMYRTCERYLSGAISQETFVVQAARDQRAMVSILAIEQLTGALRPKSTIISGPTTAASYFDGEQAAKLLQNYLIEKQIAQSEVDTAQRALDDGSETVCSEKEGEENADPAKCTALKLALDTAKADLKKAEDGLADATKLSANLTSAGTASTTQGVISSGGITATDLNTEAIIAVAKAVEAIAIAPALDESLMFCLAKLSGEAPTRINYDQQRETDNTIRDACVSIIKDRATQDNEENIKFFNLNRPSAPKR